jgi:hypothetical protein
MHSWKSIGIDESGEIQNVAIMVGKAQGGHPLLDLTCVSIPSDVAPSRAARAVLPKCDMHGLKTRILTASGC